MYAVERLIYFIVYNVYELFRYRIQLKRKKAVGGILHWNFQCEIFTPSIKTLCNTGDQS